MIKTKSKCSVCMVDELQCSRCWRRDTDVSSEWPTQLSVDERLKILDNLVILAIVTRHYPADVKQEVQLMARHGAQLLLRINNNRSINESVGMSEANIHSIFVLLRSAAKGGL